MQQVKVGKACVAFALIARPNYISIARINALLCVRLEHGDDRVVGIDAIGEAASVAVATAAPLVPLPVAAPAAELVLPAAARSSAAASASAPEAT